VKPIHFHPDVSEDIEGSFHWYEREQEGLGLQFVDEIEKSLDFFLCPLEPGHFSSMGSGGTFSQDFLFQLYTKKRKRSSMLLQ